MKIVLSDLRKISTIILTKTQDIWNNNATGYIDYYWEISLWNAYELDSNESPSLGSLVDDWKELVDVLQQKQRSYTLDFERLGNVITLVGYNNFFPDPNPVKPFGLIENADVIKLCNQFLLKTEDAGFDEINITIDEYRSIPISEVSNIRKEPTIAVQSFKDDWHHLQMINTESIITAKDFERLGRAIKMIGEMINHSLKAHEDAGIIWFCSDFDGPKEDLED